MIWKFFNDSNVMVKESTLYFFPGPEYKYGQYCTPLSQLDYRYFFVLGAYGGKGGGGPNQNRTSIVLVTFSATEIECCFLFVCFYLI